ncbi:MAG: flagellar assembly protein FliH [Deltaproteobacteria bacterium]|nr:flagellar assembly protein FliH [Deltaproteobacteria bacterium]
MVRLPKYDLQTLFEIRERSKKAAEDAFAEQQKAVAKEQTRLDEMKAELAAKVEYREKKRIEYLEKAAKGEMNVHTITQSQRHIERLKEEEAAYEVEIDKQRERLKEAEKVLDKRRQEMVDANREFKALEKHKEKWVKKKKKEIEAKEEDAAEDIAQSQFLKLHGQ